MSKRKIKNNKDEIILSKNRAKGIFVREKKTAVYQGIIPPDSIIEGYERNCQGATDRILRMAENQLDTNQNIARAEQNSIEECRKIALKIEGNSIARAQILGFILLLIMLIGGFSLIFIGKDIGGYATIAGTIVLGLRSILNSNLNNQNQEEDNNNNN